MPLRDVLVSHPARLDVLIPISEVERQTGIPQATLRMWERRYGFPRPLRNVHGDRVYPEPQVERLRVVRRLLDQGLRPSKILAGNADLEALAAQIQPAASDPALDEYQEVFAMLQQYRIRDLRSYLQVRLLNLGLRRFVIEVLSPLRSAVGLAWQYGHLPVRCEHLFTEQVTALLYATMAHVEPAPDQPRVLLATLSYEVRTLGLLMVEAVLAARQVECVRLGANLPVTEIVQASIEAKADIVALSFSTHFPRKQVMQRLAELRSALPKTTRLWAGGPGTEHLDQAPTDVTHISSFAHIDDELAAWHQARG